MCPPFLFFFLYDTRYQVLGITGRGFPPGKYMVKKNVKPGNSRSQRVSCNDYTI